MYAIRPNSTPIRVEVVASAIPAWGLARLIETAHPHMVLAGTSEGLAPGQRHPEAEGADVVLLDLDFVRHADPVAALVQDSGAKVLAITGERDEAAADRAVLSGARGVVHKSHPPDLLLQAIQQVHAGELWLSPQASTRIITALTQRSTRTGPATSDEVRIASLTAKERETIDAIVRNSSARGKQLASSLEISEHTLRNRLTGIYAKLGVSNRLDLYAYAQRHDIRA